MKLRLLEVLATILNQLPDINRSFDKYSEISINNEKLLSISDDNILTPLSEKTLELFRYRTNLTNDLVDWSIIYKILESFLKPDRYKRLNHIGFCYKVISKKKEIERIVKIISKTEISIFQEESNDDGDWIFIGDLCNIKSTMLEFIPHEGESEDIWIDYWLPHIHIDIDTNLSPEQIRRIVKRYVNNPYIPHSIFINGICYIQRVRLGCIDGVNLFLDISTNKRDINYRKTLKVM